MTTTDNHDEARTLHENQIYKALGLFLVFFALVVLVSILFTKSGIGRLTNLAAGTIIAGIGAAMIHRGRRLGRRGQ
jgi:hypothetical protein